MEAIGAAERIVEVFDHPLRETAHARARPPLERPLEIRFENVHYAYAVGRAALRGASLELASGRVTAMVGPSGAGKSTAANLLLGFVRAPLTSIFPPVIASAARERVLKKRAFQSHLSIRIGSLVCSVSLSLLTG